jgi:peptide-methionine (S)-S-oxide reductase
LHQRRGPEIHSSLKEKTVVKSRYILIAAALMVSTACSAAAPVAVPAPKVDATETGKRAVAVLAGGCFWGMEAVFERLKGVQSVTSGYAGGTAATANYSDVSSETTSHAEAIKIVYDPSRISYGTLLRVYFGVAHDPTQLNRQGPDVGPSYRSAIFPQTPAQRATSAAYLGQLSAAKSYGRAIVTKLEAGQFYAAEPHHQDFMAKNPSHPYILAHDVPKVRALAKTFPTLVK